MPLLWTLLFFGAALIPTATGIVVNSVGREYQAASSSMSQLIFNLGGYFAAPVVSAFVMDSFDDEAEGMIWGFRLCLWWSFFGIVSILIAWIVAARKFEHYTQFHDERDGKSPFEYDDQELTMPELNLEILRRRMHSYSF
jgi:MFS family permease